MKKQQKMNNGDQYRLHQYAIQIGKQNINKNPTAVKCARNGNKRSMSK